jgi:SpoVK/Ycf46/Vps4 family AAA+-type ATPase
MWTPLDRDEPVSWENLRIAPEDHRTLRAFVTAKGSRLLLYGANQRQKRISVQLIAQAHALPLFWVNLHDLVSKYIGETEKNLNALFKAAESVDAVLFFDEADALFGKRSSTSDPKSRYANQEVSYFLERLTTLSSIAVISVHKQAGVHPALSQAVPIAVSITIPRKRQGG